MTEKSLGVRGYSERDEQDRRTEHLCRAQLLFLHSSQTPLYPVDRTASLGLLHCLIYQSGDSVACCGSGWVQAGDEHIF